MNEEISIRSVQHYLYCPHRWGLMEIGQIWAENYFVTRADLLHSRVHDPDRKYALRGKRVFTAVPVYHDGEAYNLYGVVDCLEAAKSADGVPLPGEGGQRCRLCIVEYKPTAPKKQPFHEDDLMQVFAQKLCVDYVFGGDCDAILYYADAKKRVPLPLRENFAEYDRKLKQALREMREYRAAGQIPPVAKGQSCSGCSLRDLCMPSVKKSGSVRARIQKIMEEAE